MKKKLFVVLLLAAAIFVNAAKAEFQVPFLNRIASEIAKRPVVVKCRNGNEDELINYAWGYVSKPTGQAKFTVIDDYACLGALAIDLDVEEFSDFIKVVGVSALTHESFHLKRINNNENEAITECRAMKNYDHVLISLGAEKEVIARLIPLLILNHYVLTLNNPIYYFPDCKIPERYAEWGLTNI